MQNSCVHMCSHILHNSQDVSLVHMLEKDSGFELGIGRIDNRMPEIQHGQEKWQQTGEIFTH